MKLRIWLVSNSSSSSFLVLVHSNKSRLIDYLTHCKDDEYGKERRMDCDYNMINDEIDPTWICNYSDGDGGGCELENCPWKTADKKISESEYILLLLLCKNKQSLKFLKDRKDGDMFQITIDQNDEKGSTLISREIKSGKISVYESYGDEFREVMSV